MKATDVQLEKLEKGYARLQAGWRTCLRFHHPSKAVFSYKLLEKINAAQVPVWANSLMKNEDEAARHYAQERMNELKGLSVSDQYVIRMDESKAAVSEKNLLSKLDLQLIIENGGDITKATDTKVDPVHECE